MLIVNLQSHDLEVLGMNTSYTSHSNHFKHFPSGLVGLGDDYDLCSKFERTESDKFWFHPNTHEKAWAEPLLILSVLVAQHGSPESLPTLRYGLTRSKFARGLKPNPEDCVQLFEMARPHIMTDVAALKAGEAPVAARDILML